MWSFQPEYLDVTTNLQPGYNKNVKQSLVAYFKIDKNIFKRTWIVSTVSISPINGTNWK